MIAPVEIPLRLAVQLAQQGVVGTGVGRRFADTPSAARVDPGEGSSARKSPASVDLTAVAWSERPS